MAWPDYVDIDARRYRAAYAAPARRTAFDDGAVRQENVLTDTFWLREIVALIPDDAKFARFQAWAAADAAAPFDWSDPEDGVIRKVRVQGGAGGIAYRAVVDGMGRRRWEADLILEGLRVHALPDVPAPVP